MHNMKPILIIGILILIIGAAAFLRGRMLSNDVGPLGLFGPSGKTQIEILPAEKLPKTPPEVEGLFVKRQDNIILVRANQLLAKRVGQAPGSQANIGSGPELEVVITTETIIYHHTTQVDPSQSSPSVQQTIGEGTLNDLNSELPVIVWGRKNGERIIAEILLYGSPTKLHRPKL